jgi:hypothetical protein
MASTLNLSPDRPLVRNGSKWEVPLRRTFPDGSFHDSVVTFTSMQAGDLFIKSLPRVEDD